jgi:hypothetical protein
MEPIWSVAIGAALAVLPFFANVQPSAGWSLLCLFALPLCVSLFRLGFLRPLKGLGYGFLLICGFIAASFIGDGMTRLITHGAAPNAGVVFAVGLVTAFSLASGAYASLILLGESLSNGPAMRMAAVHTLIVTVAGGILAGVWAGAHPQTLHMGAIDILWAAPWLLLYGAGFYAVAAGTANPFLSGEGRRNVTEQSAARMNGLETAPRAQPVVLASLGIVAGLFVLFLTVIGAAGVGNPGGATAPATNAVDPNAPKDPEVPPEQPEAPPQPPYEPPQDGYDANPPVDQQGATVEPQSNYDEGYR